MEFGRPSWLAILLALFFLYPILCSFLRFRRRDSMLRKYNYVDRTSFSRMTNADAQAIMRYVTELEFPALVNMSLQFALFKTYGIPTISRLLVATKEFSTPERSSKRFADTTVLIGEFYSHHPRSERAIKAIARMNYIHKHYQKAGKISNDDLLYTLSVFITEPISWVERYEWRPMNDMEICAFGTFWKSIGDSMGIDYKDLKNNAWRDGIEFYEDIRAWAKAYEEKYMVPAAPNKKTADELVPLLLFYVPQVLQASLARIVGVLMGDHLRKAMIYPTPSPGYFQFTEAIFAARRFFLRYLSPPRPSFMRVRSVDDEPDPQTGRFYFKDYQAHPFYNKPGFWNRWGPDAWLKWMLGGDLPGSKGDLYIPQGYKFEEVGPEFLKNKGTKETEAFEEKIRMERPAGCPFAIMR
ncbi:hypothetical protein F5884DRAFT_673284 [Xylogone sp. PMI_703]|nr:hypothetical protein F5884DRAFT_673284 [Xylogone sp. PMI_703]